MSRIATTFAILALLTALPGSARVRALGAQPADPPAGQRDEDAPREQGKEGGPAKKAKGRGTFTIGKETTYVTGPLDADGRIDYAAALNERLGRGVTPENNANVLLWRAMGPRPEGGKPMPPEFFRLMGMAEPPEQGDYFIDLRQYLERLLGVGSYRAKLVLDSLERLGHRPWLAKECPEVTSWLEANDKPLSLVVEATRRSHYYSPQVPSKTEKGSPGLVGVMLPGVQRCRALAFALAARAMLRLCQGADAEAWEDLIACHRLGRLVGSGASLIEALVGFAIEGIARQADLAFLDRAGTNPYRLAACLQQLRDLPPLPDVAEHMDLGGRFTHLDIIMMLDAQGIGYLEGGLTGEPGKSQNLIANLMLAGIDWDPALLEVNRWYNRIAADLRVNDRRARQAELTRIVDDLKALKERATDAAPLTKAFFGGSFAKARGEAMGGILVYLLLPAFHKVQDAADRAVQWQDNLLLAFALERYRLDHGRYPPALESLAPNYLPEIPRDLFSGGALLYRPRDDGYLLYSVGANGADEGGRGYSDLPPGDDLSVRMPFLPAGRPGRAAGGPKEADDFPPWLACVLAAGVVALGALTLVYLRRRRRKKLGD